MEGIEPSENQGGAPQACSTCRRRKGRCDKVLPSCTYCSSKGLPCFYPPPPGTAVQSFVTPQAEFPAVFFLDHEVFDRSSLSFPPARSQVPLYIGSELGNWTQITTIASEYFSTVHTWLPIVSKKLFYDHHLNPHNGFGADVALLCLGMKLIIWEPPVENPDPLTPTYISARQLLDSVDLSGTLTISALQGRLLIALYEIGHAIYPAAYLSVAVCAQYGIALGLGWKAASWSKDNISWVEKEERRRVWWGVVILERYLACGWPQRRIISDGPKDKDLLPAEDVAWDEGIATRSYPITTPVPGDLNMGRFARICQAQILLDRVLAHNRDSVMTEEFLEREKDHLDKAIRSLVSFTEEETRRRNLNLCCSTALCKSALYLLHGMPHDQHGQHVLEESSSAMLVVSEGFLDGSALPLNQLSPLTFHCFYHAAAYYAGLKREDPSAMDAASALETIKSSMRIHQTRWRSAGSYLAILDARQTMSEV